MQKRNKKVTITAHTLVKNEENFIWYAIMSVLPYVDKMIVFDTGSTDKTVPIIKKILKTKEGKEKIHFEEKGDQTKQGHTDLRNEMIKMTKTDWFMILDGDEVWSKNEIKKTLDRLLEIDQDKKCILSKFIFSAGDIYHHSNWGKYGYEWGLRGHYTPRFFKNISHLSWGGEFDSDKMHLHGKSLIVKNNCVVLDNYFFHFGVLPRSSQDNKVTLGHGRRVVDYYNLGFLGHGRRLDLQKYPLPEVLFSPRPSEVPNISYKVALYQSTKNLFTKYFPF